MALKTIPTNTTVNKPTATPSAEPPAPEPTSQDSVILELALYTNYTWRGEAFQKGKAYKFKREEAMRLLQEQDHNRNIWKIYQPPRRKSSPQNVVYDATEIKADRPAEEGRGAVDPENRRIDIGDDDEIKDILGRTDPDDGNVTV